VKKAFLALGPLVAAGLVWWATRPEGVSASTSDYPLEVGLRWTYGPVERRIDRTVEVDGLRYFEMRYSLPLLGTRTLLMRRTAAGVVTTGDRLLLRFPLVEGDAWTIDLPGEKEVADCVVRGEEDVEFAGRVAKAVKLEVRRRSRAGAALSTDHEWYAPGVGLVKMEVTMGARATFTLSSFERAK
jgi:hypothetical protein